MIVAACKVLVLVLVHSGLLFGLEHIFSLEIVLHELRINILVDVKDESLVVMLLVLDLLIDV